MLCYNDEQRQTSCHPGKRALPSQTRSFPNRATTTGACAARALAAAEADFAEARGARLTAVRRKVLALIWQSHAPVGAYDLLSARLNRAPLNRQRKSPRPHPSPSTAPSISSWRKGLVHRIASLPTPISAAVMLIQRAGRSRAAQF